MPRRGGPGLVSNQCQPPIRWRKFFELRRHQSSAGTRADDCDMIWTLDFGFALSMIRTIGYFITCLNPRLKTGLKCVEILVSLLLQNGNCHRGTIASLHSAQPMGDPS